MKKIKGFIVIALLLAIPVLNAYYGPNENRILISFSLIILVFFLTNLILRANLKFKGYFLSKFNIFTQKFQRTNTFNLPIELLFDKLQEELKNANFKVRQIDHQNHVILVTTSITWKSWGENIYFTLKPVADGTQLIFESVTFFQMHDWGKNESNYEKFFFLLENSFTI